MTDARLLTPDVLAAIAARAETATPGPWYHCVSGEFDYQWIVEPPHGETALDSICVVAKSGAPNAMEDAAFIAHARQDIPALLAHASALAADRDALAAENARLRGERRVMHDVLLTLVSHIHMRAHPSNRTKWVCPYCKGTHKSLTALEEGEGHTENCPYAAARALLEGGA